MNEAWVVLKEYDNRVAADFERQRLAAAGIPVRLDDASTGLFGPGFAGSTAMGVRLLVPGNRVEEARTIIGE